MLAAKKFENFVCDVLKESGYSEDIQNAAYDTVAEDNSLPPELHQFMNNAREIQTYLYNEDIDIANVEPVLDSNNLIATPESIEHIQKLVASLEPQARAVATIAVQMTVNYINAQQEK